MKMGPDFLRCEVCATSLVGVEAQRVYQDPIAKTGLVSVRCAECTGLPCPLEVGQPCAVGWPVEGDCLYSYWSRGIGHLLLLPTDEDTSVRDWPSELGFFRAEANLPIVAFRFGANEWRWTPYSWHHYQAGHQGEPANPQGEADRTFSVAFVTLSEPKYSGIRVGTLPIDFANAFRSAIEDQIRGIPQPLQNRMEEVGRLAELQNNEIDLMLDARCKILFSSSGDN